MRSRTAVVVAALIILCPVGAAAQNAPPVAVCPDCDALAEELRQLRERFDLTEQMGRDVGERLDQLRPVQAKQQAEFNRLSGMERTAAQQARMNDLQRALNSRKATIDALSAELMRLVQLAFDLSLQGGAKSEQLSACNSRCGTDRTTPPVPANDPPPEPAPTTPTPSAPHVACPSCQSLADRLEELQRRRQTKLAELDKLELERGVLRSGLGENQAGLLGQLRDIENQINLRTEEIRDLDRDIEGIERKLEECGKTCKPTTVSSVLTQPKVYGPIGGGLLLGGLLISGGGGPTPVAAGPTPAAAPPVATTPITSSPAPQPTPAPPPAPAPAVGSPAGTHDVRDCRPIEDRARHDPTLEVCLRVLQLIISSPTAGALMVLGSSPFATMSGGYNTASGEFALSTTAVVAGFPGVQILFRGTITSAGDITGGMLTFGETGGLPTNTRIVYALATTRRR